MKILWVIAAMLMVTGCVENGNRIDRSNQQMQQQAASDEVRIKNTAHTASKLPILTQASSTATMGVPQSSISMKQVPNGSPNWFIDDHSQSGPADQTIATAQFEQQVLQLVNKQRANTGQASLVMDDNLSKMAMVKALDMFNNNYFDHNSPIYGSPFAMMAKFQINFNSAAENIAKGQTSPEQVMNDWMNSPGHRANILNSGFTKMGIAHYNGTWVQEFIS